MILLDNRTRNHLLARAVIEGWPITRLGVALGVSRQRASQLIQKSGLHREWKYEREYRKPARREIVERRCEVCSVSLNGTRGKKACANCSHERRLRQVRESRHNDVYRQRARDRRHRP